MTLVGDFAGIQTHVLMFCRLEQYQISYKSCTCTKVALMAITEGFQDTCSLLYIL